MRDLFKDKGVLQPDTDIYGTNGNYKQSQIEAHEKINSGNYCNKFKVSK